MGKYDAVVDSLIPAPVENLSYQEKVDEAKLEFTVDLTTGEALELTPERLGVFYAALRKKHAEIEEQRYALQVKITALEQLISTSWENDEEGWGAYGAGPNTVKLRDGSAVDVECQPEGKVVDKEAFRRWCIASADHCMDCGDPISEHSDREHKPKPGGGLEAKLQLWPSTMNAIAKERTLAGEPPPDGVAVYRRVAVKFRKP